MPARNELNIRAAAVGLDYTTVPNDSKLEQRILYLEKRQSAITATAPTTTLTSTGVALDTETFTVGSKTYTMKTALSSATAENEILIGADASTSLDNIKSAINGTAGAGTTYGSNTKRHPDVTAGAKNSTTLVIASADSNSNSAFATTETLTNFSFTSTTASAGVLGSKSSGTSTTAGAPGISGDVNTSL